MYGCSSNKGADMVKEKIFPNLLGKNCDIFSFPDTCFAIQKSKESTARVVTWKELNIVNSYTLEASFCGADFGKYVDYHFNAEMLQEVGRQFCQTIYDFCDPDQVKIRKAMEELEILYPAKDPDNEDGDRYCHQHHRVVTRTLTPKATRRPRGRRRRKARRRGRPRRPPRQSP